jgi:hypothetical protein
VISYLLNDSQDTRKVATHPIATQRLSNMIVHTKD